MKTKYNFNKQKFCEGLTAEKLKDLGFTNHYKPHWYYNRIISPDLKYGGVTINVSIDLKNIEKSEIDILDEAWLQPLPSLYRYYMNETDHESLTKYIQSCVKNCDKIIAWLIDNNIIYFEE